jgi:ABC-type phosphate/phosphonate transport system substrate-binding protein
MMDSLFEETDEKRILAQMQPFVELVKKRTGLAGEFQVVRGVDKMREGLKSGKLSLGVVLGLDYAWLRIDVPDAVPLVVAVNESTTMKAHVLVHKDSEVKQLADLKDKPLALPRRTPRFARFYLEREMQQLFAHPLAQPLAQVFKVQESADAEEAIESVIDRTAEATLITALGLDVYRQRKPVRFNRLRVLHDSPEFPTPAVIYRPGTAKEEDARRFRDALLRSNDTAEGQQTLTLWRLTGFRTPPAEYVKQVDELAKRYPRDGK